MISEDYDGRPACNGCGICSGCARGSMSKYSLSIWPKALAAGRGCAFRRACCASRRGRTAAPPARCSVDRVTGAMEFQPARIVILAGNGVGTPRLLLASDNLANSSDQVGRNLLHHTLVACEFWVDEPIDGHMGYVASMISREFAETDISRGFVNGFQFNCLTSTSAAGEIAAGWLAEVKAPWGRGHHAWFERRFGHNLGLFAIGDDLPNPENRVTPRSRPARRGGRAGGASCTTCPARTTAA